MSSARARRIFFVHVPKCGGTSVVHAIERACGANRWTRATRASRLDAESLHRAAERLGTDRDRLAEQLLAYHLCSAELRVVSGHYRFSESLHARFEGEWDFVTLLREPVERFISNYFFNRHVLGEPYGIADDLATFLASDRAVTFGNVYVQYFAGSAYPRDEVSRETIEKAKTNLSKFACVGILERLADFREDFRRRYGVRLRIGRENSGPRGDGASRVSAGDRTRIEALCAPDLEVYRAVLSRLG